MKKCFKSILSVLLVVITLLSTSTVSFAAPNKAKISEDYKKKIELLVEKGYTEETATALSEADVDYIYNNIVQGKNVDIYTCSMEIDNLAEIESFYSLATNELVDMGMSEQEIIDTRNKFENMYAMNNCDLKKVYDFDDVEIRLFRMAVDSGKQLKTERERYGKELKNVVSASGSISSSRLTYTQTATPNSSSLPNYTVKLAYTWNDPYLLACFNDKIAAAWGGGLNCKNYSGTANYYGLSALGTSWTGYLSNMSMSKEITPNAGIIFTFPQSKGYDSYGNGAKTKNGSATFTLYQTKKQGYETTLVSNYCHRVISVSSANISISASGPSVSLSIGGAWDKSPQKQSIVGY